MPTLEEFLRAHDIDAPRIEHPAVMTVEESNRLVPPLPAAKTKNLFLRDRKGRRHLLCTVPGNLAVDLGRLGVLLDTGSLGFASPERLQKHLGITPGCVSVLALFNDTEHAVEFVVDRTLWEAAALQAHPLVNTATVCLSHAGLERFLRATGHEARVIDFPARESVDQLTGPDAVDASPGS